MLNEAERRRLSEIEAALRRADPHFVRHFDAERRRRWHWRILGLVTLLLAMVSSVIAVLEVSIVGAVFSASGTVVAAGAWWASRCR